MLNGAVRKFLRSILAISLALPTASTQANADEIPAPNNLSGRVSVIDGDTIELHGARIRLEGIDAFESSQLCERDGASWQCGREAAFALADLVGQRVVQCEGQGRDRYGRVLARCALAGDNLNAWMVRNGWALAYRRYSQDYVDEEDEARERRAGVWAGTFDPPWEWRKRRR